MRRALCQPNQKCRKGRLTELRLELRMARPILISVRCKSRAQEGASCLVLPSRLVTHGFCASGSPGGRRPGSTEQVSPREGAASSAVFYAPKSLCSKSMQSPADLFKGNFLVSMPQKGDSVRSQVAIRSGLPCE